jgi:hypothetical protein
MKRRLVNFAAMVSLALAVVFAGLWGFSYCRSCSFGYYAGADQQGWYWDYYFHSYRGSISYTWFRQGGRSTTARDTFRGNVSTWDEPNRWPWLWADRDDLVGMVGFFYERRGVMSGPLGVGMGWRTIAVPYWFLIALAMMMPVVWFRREGRGRRVEAGRCAVCGYDLRAHRWGDRCPECGTEVHPHAAEGNGQ